MRTVVIRTDSRRLPSQTVPGVVHSLTITVRAGVTPRSHPYSVARQLNRLIVRAWQPQHDALTARRRSRRSIGVAVEVGG